VPDLGVIAAPWTDLFRLLAVPLYGWAALRDVRTRRVPNAAWLPVVVLGAVLLLVDAIVAWTAGGYLWFQFAVGTAVSLALVIPLVYGLWLLGGFGGADAKAVMALAVLVPVFPQYQVGTTLLPVVDTTIGSFVLTVLTNAVVLGLLYPLSLAVLNLLRGDLSLVMAVGKRCSVDTIGQRHGRLLESPQGLVRQGLDLDALRMYLRWRGTDLATLRANPDRMRDPASLPEAPNPPTDGAVADGGTYDDPWGANAFLEAIDGDAYGTDPATLRDGLETIVSRETVWISPGIPFLLPLFGGLIVGLTFGDVLYAVLTAVGVVPPT